MQPTPKQTVPPTSSVPAKLTDQAQAAAKPQPLPLDPATLGQIGGGLGSPKGAW